MNKSVKEARAGLIPSEETENLPEVTLRVTYREYDTILAALRFWQAQGCEPIANVLPVDQQQIIADIASDHGERLDDTEIDEVIERMFDDTPETLPVMFMEGGLIQDAFYPVPDGKGKPFTEAEYDLLDMDVLEGNTDEDIAQHFLNLSAEAQAYFKKHVPDAWKPVSKAIARHKAAQRRAAKKGAKTNG